MILVEITPDPCIRDTLASVFIPLSAQNGVFNLLTNCGLLIDVGMNQQTQIKYKNVTSSAKTLHVRIFNMTSQK